MVIIENYIFVKIDNILMKLSISQYMENAERDIAMPLMVKVRKFLFYNCNFRCKPLKHVFDFKKKRF